MGSLTVDEMRNYLGRSLSTVNDNKLNGLRAEIEFRKKLEELGMAERVSMGGWLARNYATVTNPKGFGDHVIALFPHVIKPNNDYSTEPNHDQIPLHLHTICATFHQLGIKSYFGWPIIPNEAADTAAAISWRYIQLGVPYRTRFVPLEEIAEGFERRTNRRSQYLKKVPDEDNLKKISGIEEQYVPDEFSKENIRVQFSEWYRSEIVDIDGVFWGQRFTYPIEIKEKTVADSKELGGFFGIDAGPFVKLTYYAAKKSNLHSLFVVREIHKAEKTEDGSPLDRKLKQWWIIPFDQLAQYASWTPQRGGKNMRGGDSYVIKIPAPEFIPLTKEALQNL